MQPSSSPKLPEPPQPPFFLRGNLTEYRRRLGTKRLSLGFTLTLYFLYKFGFVGWLISIAVLVAIISLILLLMISRSIRAEDSTMSYRRIFKSRRTISYDEIESVKVFENFNEFAFSGAQKVIIGFKQKSWPIKMYEYYWLKTDVEKLLALFKQKNVSIEYYDQPVTAAVIAKQFPRYASFSELHARLVITITIVVTTLVLAGGIVGLLLVLPTRSEQAIQQAKDFKPSGTCTAVQTLAVHPETNTSYTFPTSCLAPGWERYEEGDDSL